MDAADRRSRAIAWVRGRRRLISVSLYGFVTVLPQLTSGILAILYTRVFAPGEYGNYGILAALISLISILMSLGFPAAALRNYFGDEVNGRLFLSRVIVCSRLAMLATIPPIAIVLFVFWSKVGVRFQQAWLFIPALIAISYVDQYAEVLATVCRVLERSAMFAFGRIVQSTVFLAVGIILVLHFRLGIGGSLLAVLAGESAGLIAFQIAIARRLQLPSTAFSWQVLKSSLSFGLPLVPNRLAGWGRQLAFRPLLAHLAPLKEVGQFSFAASLATIPNLISTSIDLAITPIYFQRREAAESKLGTLKMLDFSTIQIAGMFPIWVASILLSPEIVRLLAGPKYAGAGLFCAILLCASYVRMQTLFLQRQIFFLRQMWLFAVVTIPLSVMGIVLTLVAVPHFGTSAAAWAIVVTDVLILMALVLIVRRVESVGISIPTGAVLAGALIVLAVWISSGEAGSTSSTLLLIKLGIFLLALIASTAIWIWPRRSLLAQILSS